MVLGEVPEGLNTEIIRNVRDQDVMNILYVGGLDEQRQRIARYMENEGFAATQTSIHGEVTWDYVFTEYEIDILLVGDHPDGADACVEFARRVVQWNPLIDVLVYGVPAQEPVTKYDRSLYTEVLTYPGADYAEPAIEMIQMHQKKWNDVLFLRGLVITQIVDIESLINDALAVYFGLGSDTVRGRQFVRYVLENPLYLLDGKKRALQKILARTELSETWQGMNRVMSELQSKRNKIAHCEVDPNNPNVIESMGKTYRYGRASMRAVLKDARRVRRKLLFIIEALEKRA